MKARAAVLKRQEVFKGYCFDVSVDEVIWPNGQRLKRSLVRHPGISVMVPELGQERIILVRQYRYGADEVLWELPAGTLKPRESALSCAKRELQEEIGYRAGRWRKLGACYASPGFNTEIINCFHAWDLKETSSALEEDEILEPKIFTFGEVRTIMRGGKIRDAKTLVALYYFFEGLK